MARVLVVTQEFDGRQIGDRITGDDVARIEKGPNAAHVVAVNEDDPKPKSKKADAD